MGAIPGGVETDRQPPMSIPLRHFVVGLGFLVAGAFLGLGTVAGAIPGLTALAHVHLLLAGWVCLTIMGAMTQFVPVWSGVSLYSRRLASAQLTLVAVGLSGFVASLLLDSLSWLIPFGGLMALGFWVFVYNLLRTMAPIDDYDVTERHFLYSAGFFLLVTTLGLVLAIDFTTPVFAFLPVQRAGVVASHATLAVFGAVLTAVYGALYQLGTMFTQTELHRVDEILRRVEESGHPAGVALLAAGRFGGVASVAGIGAGLILVAALSVSVVLGRKLYEMRVDRAPMHTRYAVAVLSLPLWALLTAPAWLTDPTGREHLLGSAGAAHLLVLGAVGFVVLGTLYHVVPFIVWVHRYSDRLGFEDVPMVDDLYDDRLAAADATLLAVGTAVLVASEWFGLSVLARGAGGAMITLGVAVFAANMLLVVRTHSPHSLVGLFS
ncbi:MAG: hypothetical protein V5A39_04455 [Haloarculaceae archaeon]